MRGSSNLDLTASAAAPDSDGNDDRSARTATNVCVERAFDGPFDERTRPFNLQAHLDDAKRIVLMFETLRPLRIRADAGGRRQMLQHLSIRFWIWIVELPSGQQAIDLFAQRAVGERPHMLLSELRMGRELREHSDEPVGNHLAAGVGGGLDDLDDRVDRHAAGCAEHERPALREVSAHRKESLQRFRPQFCNQASRTSAKRSEICAGGAAQLLRDLKQIADDNLVVGSGSAMLVDRLRHNGGLRRGGLGLL